MQNLKSHIGWLKGPRTFRARVFWSLIPIILLLVILLGVVDLRQHRRLAEGELMERGQTMAANLARGSKLAVFTEDRQLLEFSMRSVTGDANFAYVLIYGEDWKVLAEAGELITSVKQQTRDLSDGHKDRLLRQRKAFFKRVADKKGRFVEFVVPIIAVETNTPYELQIGTIRRGTRNTEQAQPRVLGAVRLGLSLKNVDSHLAALLKWRGGLIVVFLFLSTLVIYVFSRRITRPIKQLTDQATKIADGHLDQTIPVDSRDEIGQLAISFNDMTQALKGNINEKELALAQLRELNQTLEHRIHQRTAKIEAINLELQDATRHKSQFLANVNHEFRTPVSAIIGYSRLMLRETEGQMSQLQRDNLKDLLHNAEHLLNMTNSLLDLAKIEAGRLEVRVEPVQINTLIDELLTMVTSMVHQDRVRVIRDIAPDIPTLNSDSDKLRQIILNLLSNAAKFTEEGEIKVSASRSNGSLTLSVSDTGIGIREEELQYIFDEFRQGDMSNGRKYTGTGLGLAIAKKFANLLGGDITVESEVGKGSTFTVTLPVGLSESLTK